MPEDPSEPQVEIDQLRAELARADDTAQYAMDTTERARYTAAVNAAEQLRTLAQPRQHLPGDHLGNVLAEWEKHR